MTQPDYWENCYDKGWKGIALDASMAHPAKFSRGLIFRIVEHAIEEGWVQPGGVILDPFSGVACGALPCLQYGLNYVGVELEEKFVTLARENIALWNARYAAHFPNWGTAQVLQGDSRRLCEVVSGAGEIIVSSPPYADVVKGREGPGARSPKWVEENCNDYDIATRDNAGKLVDYGETSGQLGAMVVGSPPFAGNTGGRGEASRNGIDAALFDRHSGGMKKGTGDDPANLDHLPMGDFSETVKFFEEHNITADDLAQFIEAVKPTAIVSSPPYAEGLGHDAGHPRLDATEDKRRAEEGSSRRNGYGESNGQLGAMKAGAAVIGSPPYADTERTGVIDFSKVQRSPADTPGPRAQGTIAASYGSTDGQIGATQGQTFWEAARLIVQQCALLLPVGGAAIFVVKNYIKNGVEVDFTGQWQQLCEACGFETVHIHRAMLVKENGAQGSMFGADKKNKVERKSFFRRLAEAAKKADTHWETLRNEDRVALIAAAYESLFKYYLDKLKESGGKKPAAITKRRLMREAKSKAWLRDGRPDYEIETSIDFETVLCMRKAASPKGTRSVVSAAKGLRDDSQDR